jgi:hypothetical protein
MIDRSAMWRQILGWTAISISTAAACFWAFWGVNENFHEGWFSTSFWQNIGLMFAQYLSPMLIVLALSVLAFRWPRLAIPLVVVVALALAWFFHRGFIPVVFIGVPLVAMGLLYHFGQPQPRRWAWRCLIGLPLITAVACGAYPCWLAEHRFDDGNYGMRQIAGNGVTLIWAPEGPGWTSRGASWSGATKRCAHLTADGLSVAHDAQNIWRLPTVDEAVRSLVFRGNNAGGVWDPTAQRAHYRTTPDKDSPLWKVHSQVIYWWTSTETGGDQAYYVTYNGYVISLPEKFAPGYLGFRCVCEPSNASLTSSGHE